MTWIRKNDQDPTESGSDNNMILWISKNDQDPAESGSDNNMSLSVLL